MEFQCKFNAAERFNLPSAGTCSPTGISLCQRPHSAFHIRPLGVAGRSHSLLGGLVVSTQDSPFAKPRELFYSGESKVGLELVLVCVRLCVCACLVTQA